MAIRKSAMRAIPEATHESCGMTIHSASLLRESMQEASKVLLDAQKHSFIDANTDLIQLHVR